VVSEEGKVTVPSLRRMKREGKRIAMVTAYDYPSAALAEKAGMDVILVGDSLGMVVLGYESTTPVTMEEMLHHCRAVSRAAKRPMIVGDLPFMSYQASSEEAIRNSGRLVKEGGVDAVKPEGGSEFAQTVRAIARVGIPVMGHIGLTPQTAPLWGGYRVHGRTVAQAKRLLEDAKALEEAGAFSIVLEMVTAEAAKIVTEALSIPTIGIGSGPSCDGQVLVLHDMLGLFERFTPRFVKQYANLSAEVAKALQAYADDVKTGRFPGEEHSFHMAKEEYEKLPEEMRRGARPGL